MSSLSLFLGPNGENKDLLIDQVIKSLEYYINVRKFYNNNQPKLFDENFKNSNQYLKSQEFLNDKVDKLCEYLKDSVHFESLNYQSQMNADLLVPGLIGHITGLMYNQNNVAHQGSPKTTLLEHAFIIDLIKMVGFDLPDDFKSNYYQKDLNQIINIEKEKDLIIPSGHLTSGGSLSNIESCLCSMWVKFLPLSIKNSILKNEFLNLKDLKIKQFDQYKSILEMNNWELCNIISDEVVKLPYSISIDCKIALPQVYKTILKYHPLSLGLYDFLKKNNLNSPSIIIPITAHYSFQKSATALGIGINNMITVEVDKKGRMITSKLYQKLLYCIKNEIPVINVVSILGSTQEGSVDNVEEILSIRNNLRNYFNFNFDIHIDGAFGGYFISLIKDAFDIENPIDCSNLFNETNINYTDLNSNLEQFEPELICSNYLKKQLYNCKFADTITIDPHKTGYSPYQCGSLLYRNSKYKNILSISRHYIEHSSLSLGLESIEGSRGGQSVTSSYLNHCICRPNKFGYGLILKKCLLISKIYLIRLLFLSDNSDQFTTHTLGLDFSNTQIQYFKNECFNKDGKFKDIEIICSNESLLQLLSEIGFDLPVVCFNFNFKLSNNGGDFQINRDYNRFLQFNETIMKRFSYINGPHNDLIISSTYFDTNYGSDDSNSFLMSTLHQIGIKENIPKSNINIKIPALRASIMNPYLYKFLDQTMNILKKSVNIISKSFINN